MKKEELKKLLIDLAEKDLVEGADIFDHPCSVAIRVIEQSEPSVTESGILCRVGWHEWGRWIDVGKSEIAMLSGKQPMLHQEKRCLNCNACKKRKVL